MSSCCPICYRVAEGYQDPTNVFGESERFKKGQRFFKLVTRYLGKGNGHENGTELPFPLEQFEEIGILFCGECVTMMNSFCELYNQLTTIELRLDWKVQKLKNLMREAERVPSRINSFQRSVRNLKVVENEQMDGEDIIQDVIKCRKSLMRKCSRKMNNAFPKLLISKIDCNRTGSSSSVIAEDQDNDNGGEVCKSNPSPSLSCRSCPTPVEQEVEALIKTEINDVRGGSVLMKDAPLTDSSQTTHVAEVSTGTDKNSCVNNTENDASGILPQQRTVGDLDQSLIINPASPSPLVLNQTKFAKWEVNIESECANDNNASMRRSSLRRTHPCQTCRMTFTSIEKLQGHVDQQHNNSDTKGRTNYSSSDDEKSNNDDDHGESGSLCLSLSAASKDDDHDFEIDENSDESEASESEAKAINVAEPPKSVPKTETSVSSTISSELFPSSGTTGMAEANKSEIVDKPKKTKKKYKPPKTNSEVCFPSRLKCPDCNILFEDVQSILTHRKNSDSCPCRASYNPKTSIRVEIFAEAETQTQQSRKNMAISGSDDEDSTFTKRVAVINLPQEIFLCEQCDIAVYSSMDKEEHDKLHVPFQCNFCKVKPASALALVKHERKHAKRANNNKKNKEKWLYCTRCELKFSEKQRSDRKYAHHFLNAHLSLSLNEPKCAICKTNNKRLGRHGMGKHFKSHHDLTHIVDLADLKKCTVPNCNAYFLTILQLNDHLMLRHKWANSAGLVSRGKRDGIQHHCKDCDMTFAKLEKLRRHRMRKHVAWDKVIPCSMPNCEKVFESQTDLERHIRIGAGADYHKSLEKEGPPKKVLVECPICKRLVSGKHPSHLKLHLKFHREDCICETCGKTFKDNHHLNVHRLTHSGPESWEFMCSVCSKKCLTRPKLDEHMRTHTKAKPFVCEICGVKYAHRHNLRIHVNSKHGDQVEDKPRKFTKRNITSRKGIKRKKLGSDEEEEDDTLTELVQKKCA